MDVSVIEDYDELLKVLQPFNSEKNWRDCLSRIHLDLANAVFDSSDVARAFFQSIYNRILSCRRAIQLDIVRSYTNSSCSRVHLIALIAKDDNVSEKFNQYFAEVYHKFPMVILFTNTKI